MQREYEKRVDPNDKNAQALLEEMRQHVKKLEDMRKNEDPRLSFSTPEFKEAQRIFTDGFKVSKESSCMVLRNIRMFNMSPNHCRKTLASQWSGHL